MTNPNARTVLVAAASRHGSTAEIAVRIGGKLREELPSQAWHVQVTDTDSLDAIEGYDAVILGSAVYLGRWLKSARQHLENAEVPPPLGMWIFNSGPVDVNSPGCEPAETNEELTARLGIRGNVVFPGRLERGRLGRFERAVTSAMRIAYGDFRDWAAIDSWASGIAHDLLVTVGEADEEGPYGGDTRDLLP